MYTVEQVIPWKLHQLLNLPASAYSDHTSLAKWRRLLHVAAQNGGARLVIVAPPTHMHVYICTSSSCNKRAVRTREWQGRTEGSDCDGGGGDGGEEEESARACFLLPQPFSCFHLRRLRWVRSSLRSASTLAQSFWLRAPASSVVTWVIPRRRW